jgi:hypothetical protein
MTGFKDKGRWGGGPRWSKGWCLSRREGDYVFPGYGPAMWWDIPAARSYATLEEELADLRSRVQMLTRELEMVHRRIAEVEKEVDQTLDG